MEMSDRIKELRIKNSLTQDELAQKLGLKKSAIAKYESGRVKNIKRSTILKMAEILNTTPSYLLGVEEQSNVGYLMSYVKDNKEMQLLIQSASGLSDSSKKRLLNYIELLKTEEKEEND